MTSSVEIMFILAVVMVAAKLGGAVAYRLGQPAVLGELLAGVVLGPSLINITGLPWFHHDHATFMRELAELGVVLLMFLAGVETDLTELNRAKKVSFFAGTLGVLVPLGMGTLLSWLFGFEFTHAIFIGLVLTATSVSISVRTLTELGALRRREGTAILGAAVIDDVQGILLLSLFLALISGDGGDGGMTAIVVVLAKMAVFFAAAILGGSHLLPRFVRWLGSLPVSEGLAGGALACAFVFAWLSEVVGGVSLIVGAYIAGALLSRTDLREQVEERLHALAYGFLVPVFFIGIGLNADLRSFDRSDIVFLVALCAVAVVSKVIGCGLGAWLAGMTPRESLRVGIGMISRGEVGLIVASVGMSAGLVDAPLFAIIVVMIMVTTLVTPVLLRWAFSEPEKEAAHA